MKSVELKADLINILDRLENEQLLQAIYDFLKENEHSEEGRIWKTLTEDQKEQVLLSYEESLDEKNLIDWEDVKKKF